MNKKIRKKLIALFCFLSFIVVFIGILIFTQYFGQRIAIATNILIPQFFWINVFYPSDSDWWNNLILWTYQYFSIGVNIFLIFFLFLFFISLKKIGVFQFFKSFLLMLISSCFWMTSVMNYIEDTFYLMLACGSSSILIAILLSKYFLKLYYNYK